MGSPDTLECHRFRVAVFSIGHIWDILQNFSGVADNCGCDQIMRQNMQS